ncbi:MAG: GNAT family N-acetyltransferase [Candidatus Methylumidiphilus sp.]
MKLRAVTTTSPPGSLKLLVALGNGENGFGGTPVGSDPSQLDDWLDYCVHIAKAPPLSEYFVPQANYWITDDAGHAVGLVRIRPQINKELLNKGGHVGYYVAPAFRNQGYGKGALKLALLKLCAKGVKQALVTIESHNTVSLCLVTDLGGVLEDERIDDETGHAYRRFWLKTDLRTKTKQSTA